MTLEQTLADARKKHWAWHEEIMHCLRSIFIHPTYRARIDTLLSKTGYQMLYLYEKQLILDKTNTDLQNDLVRVRLRLQEAKNEIRRAKENLE